MASVEAVARENGAAIEALGPGGTAVFPADDAFAPLWRALAGGRAALTFALAAGAGRRVRPRRMAPTAAAPMRLHTPAGAAVAAPARRRAPQRAERARRHGLRARPPAARSTPIVRGLEAFEPVKGRSQLQTLERGGRGGHADRRQLQRQPRFGARRHRRAGRAARRRAGWCWATWARSATRGRRSTPRSAPTRAQRGIDALWTRRRAVRRTRRRPSAARRATSKRRDAARRARRGAGVRRGARQGLALHEDGARRRARLHGRRAAGAPHAA